MSNKKGFTLVELVVVMGIFIAVILISTYAFENIIRAAARETKSVETQIEGLIGLEILRADVQQAGYGLPWGFMNMNISTTYLEAASVANSPVTGINRFAYNDTPGTPPSVPPRAVVSGNNAGLNGSDFLVIKSVALADNATAKKWTYVNYAAGGGSINRMNNNEDLATGERVIIIRSGFTSTGEESRNLVGDSATVNVFSHTLTGSPPTTLPVAFSPADASENYSIYGIDPDTNLRMPFNRADYYIKKPDETNAFPKSCNPSTGILYKATLDHADGGYSSHPLLDCVADMQVVYFLDMNNDGEAGTYANADGTSSSGSETISGSELTDTLASAQLLRQRLKEIRIYILAQEGGKDRNFSYPSQNVTVGEFGQGSTFDLLAKLGADWKNYRWKVYTIVVEPKNLGS